MLISHLKLIKNHLRNSLNDKSLSNVKIALESPAKLANSHLEIVDVWNQNIRRVGKLDTSILLLLCASYVHTNKHYNPHTHAYYTCFWYI